jgi:hypothetical protein
MSEGKYFFKEPYMNKLKMAFLFCLASSIANADPIERRKVVVCDSVETIFKTLFEEFQEQPIWFAKDGPSPTQYVLTVNVKEDTWTLVQYDNTQACVIGVGNGSRLAPTGKPV